MVYRVNDPRTYYDYKYTHSVAKMIHATKDNKVEMTEGVSTYPIAHYYDPGVTRVDSSKDEIKGPQTIQVVNESTYVPKTMQPVFTMTVADEVLEEGEQVLLTVDAEARVDGVFATGSSFQIDVGDILVGGAALVAPYYIQTPSVCKAVQFFVGMLKPLVKGKWTIKGRWTFKQIEQPNELDSLEFTFNVRLHAYSMYQVFRELLPADDSWEIVEREDVVVPETEPGPP